MLLLNEEDFQNPEYVERLNEQIFDYYGTRNKEDGVWECYLPNALLVPPKHTAYKVDELNYLLYKLDTPLRIKSVIGNLYLHSHKKDNLESNVIFEFNIDKYKRLEIILKDIFGSFLKIEDWNNTVEIDSTYINEDRITADQLNHFAKIFGASCDITNYQKKTHNHEHVHLYKFTYQNTTDYIELKKVTSFYGTSYFFTLNGSTDYQFSSRDTFDEFVNQAAKDVREFLYKKVAAAKKQNSSREFLIETITKV